MSENLHNIDKLFRDGIEGQHEPPPTDVWNELDKKLDKKKVASIAGKYNKLKWVAAALFLFSFIMAMHVYNLHRYTDIVIKERKTAPAIVRKQTYEGAEGNTTGKQPTVDQQSKDSMQTGRSPAPVPSEIKNNLPEESSVPAKKGEQAEAVAAKDANHLPAHKSYPLPAERSRQSGSSEAIRLHKLTENSTLPGNQHQQGRAGDKSTHLAIVKERSRKAAGEVVPPSFPDKLLKNSTAQQPAGRELHAVLIGADLPGTQSAAVNIAHSLPSLHVRSLIPDSVLTGIQSVVKLSPVRQAGFTATIFFSPNLVSNSIKNDAPHFREDDRKAIRDKEQNGSSWSAGVLLAHPVGGDWSIESGFLLSARTTVVQPKTIFARPDDHGTIKYRFNCSSGYSYIDLKQGNNPFNGDSADAVSSNSKLQYVSVPVSLKYNIGNGRLRFSTGFGLQMNILVSQNLETYVTKGNNREHVNSTDIHGLRSVYFSGMLSAGATYKINNVFAASLMPNAHIGFMSINERAPVKSYINFYGIAAGISVKL